MKNRARTIAMRLSAAAATALALPGLLRAQANEQWVITPSTGTNTQQFGFALAIDGDTMVVGAPYNDSNGADRGTAWIYSWDATAGTWNASQQLFASDGENYSRFGWSVAIKGDLIVVGAPFKDTTIGTDSGQIYVFRFDSTTSTWIEEQRLIQSTGANSDKLGTAVAVSGDVVLTGVPYADTKVGANSGAVFVFRYDATTHAWAEETELIDPDGSSGDHAGTSIDYDGNYAVVASANQAESTYSDAGSVGIWTASGTTWSQIQELTAPTLQQIAEFGTRVRLSGDVIGVTAPLENQMAGVTASGAAYVFRRVNGVFTFEARLTESTPTAYAKFGTDIALSSDLIVVGANLDDVAGKLDSGAAHTFRRSKRLGWVYDQQLSASDRANQDFLGTQVALHSAMILAAADRNDTGSGSNWGVIDGYARSEMTLTIEPTDPAAGQSIAFTAFRGDPGDLCLDTIEDVGGTFMFVPVLIYSFGNDHTLTFTANAPNPLYGISVGLRSYKVSPTGPIVKSSLSYVDV